MARRGVAILGATGSIGTSTISVIRSNRDSYFVTSLAANKSWEALVPLIEEFAPSVVSVTDPEAADKLRAHLPAGQGTLVRGGSDSLNIAATAPHTDIVLCACSGAIGISSAVSAIEAGIDVALANKEVLVAGGEFITALARKHGVKLLPVDSEHSAIFQAIGTEEKNVSKIILTASGGPFRDFTRERLKTVTKAMALKHPNWSMGSKITIDSATLMNKGLEVIEAHWLFNTPYDKIEVVIHPQSIIHSLVEMKDTSVIAQLGLPDMRLPIQCALSWPLRLDSPHFESLDLIKVGKMTFLAPDMEAFPSLKLAYDAGRAGKSYPTVLNSANEIAVAAFLNDEISFVNIPQVVAEVISCHEAVAVDSLDAILTSDLWARKCAREIISSL
jgi:1-deoxy-D-xylulose-5-phosphate reductoisomerase